MKLMEKIVDFITNIGVEYEEDSDTLLIETLLDNNAKLEKENNELRRRLRKYEKIV